MISYSKDNFTSPVCHQRNLNATFEQLIMIRVANVFTLALFNVVRCLYIIFTQLNQLNQLNARDNSACFVV